MSQPATDPSQEPLSGLLDKYRRLLRLRSVRAVAPPRAELRALSLAYPGALRELDQLPLDAIEARLSELEHTLAQGAPPELWMRLQVSYHGYMRAALRIKRWARRWPDDAVAAALELAQRYVPAADEPPIESLDAATLSTICSPPQGRLNPVVLAAVARLHGVHPEQVQRALFPR
jgi:hypothetical protein